MTWIKDDNGDNKFIPSLYTKRELPTWSEIYYEFYKGNVFSYDINNDMHHEYDRYWKTVHKRKVLLAKICNQFNKMIFEDGIKENLLDYINNNLWPECTDIRFTLENISMFHTNMEYEENPDLFLKEYENFLYNIWYKQLESLGMCSDKFPPIYTIQTTDKQLDEFIIKSPYTIRKNIVDINSNLIIHPVIKIDNKGPNEYNIWCPSIDYDAKYFMKIIEFILKDIKKYFEK